METIIEDKNDLVEPSSFSVSIELHETGTTSKTKLYSHKSILVKQTNDDEVESSTEPIVVTKEVNISKSLFDFKFLI